MMPVENQVCSLELSERLKCLGVLQDSLFYWYENKIIYRDKDKNWGASFYAVSAFTVAELGELLPIEMKESKEALLYWSRIWHEKRIWFSEGDRCFDGNTEAESRAKMLIYLLENKLLNPPSNRKEER